ncbi:hypothetical protein TrVE_jg801 [Triparma verrucosa]|uniref:Bacterial surface antigen (D15) domain-containing protein n=1 Tax=Triparma verrucosa TaxID=1606542 RepID=A0A9W7EYL9_9STRA|nr:hypothetical protein TrVE_jg801 [Triparma verrucosa]
MHSTNCYDTFIASLEQAKDDKGNVLPGGVHVKLRAKEKNWYKIHVGGDLKQNTSSFESSSSPSFSIPEVQMTSSLTLRNSDGNCGMSSINYNVSQTGSTSFNLGHFQPLFSAPKPGSKSYGLSYKETSHLPTRSYSETSKSLYYLLRSGPPSTVPGSYTELEWRADLRNVMPNLHASVPYAYDSSEEILAESGPNFKHSLKLTASTNGAFTHKNRYVPYKGLESTLNVELAGPPGDVGYLKTEVKGGIHIPIYKDILSSHFHVALGGIKVLKYGGMCNPVSNVSDRFYVGGPMVFRGFERGGVGPKGGRGDAIGGEVYHGGSLQLSTPFPHPVIEKLGGRIFTFGSVGGLSNLADITSISAVKESTRVTAGIGVAVPLGNLGRGEASWAKILRKGEGDVVQPMQFGLNLHFG